MVIDNKYFVGGLNSDDEDRVIPNGDYRYALNIRNSKSDADSQGSIENVKGNTVTSVYFGVGNYKCIGAYDDKLNNKVYWFVYSDQLNHLIMEFDVVSNTTQVVIYGAALNFQEDKPIIEQNIAVIDGLMYWTDEVNPPRKINIAQAKLGQISGFDEVAISAIKPAPKTPPRAKYGTNKDVKTNNVRSKLFQFRYKFVYDDNEESAWSSISKVAVPNTDDSSTLAQNENRYRPFSYYDTSLNNYIKVSVDMPNSILVKKIKIAFREQNTGDFYLAEDKKIIDIPLGSSTYDFDFYNNESYTSIDNDGNTGMRLFDNVPLLSNTQSLIDGNRIAYGGITEGYDPIDVDIIATPKYTTTPRTPQVYFVVSGGSLANPQIAFHKQFAINPALYNDPANYSYFSAYAYSPLNWYGLPAGLIVNGIPYYLNNHSATLMYGQRLQFISINSPSNTLIPVTDKIYQEYVIGNSNIQEGTRFTVSIGIEYFDYSLGISVLHNPKFQIVAALGDGALEIGNKIKAQLPTFSTSTPFIDITIFDVYVKQGGWVMGFNSPVVTSSDVVVQFKVQAVLKQIVTGGYPQHVNIGGIDTFGVPSAPYFKTAFALRSCISDLRVYSDWTLITEKSLKNGANHGVGLVYYDFANRSGLTNISKTKLFYVPYPTENNTARPLVPNGHYISSTDLELTINHKAPNWATHYQVVYTGNQTVENIQNSTGYKGFIQFKIDTYANSVITGAVQCKISELQQFNNETPESVDIGYGFSKGDRIRFLMDANGDYLTQYIDVEIISYDTGTGVLTFKKPNATVGSGYTVEIYTPKKQIDNTFYYEVGEVRAIDSDGQHFGDSQNQIFDSSGTLLQPAKLLLTDIGDVYMRFRVKPTERQIEDYHYSDYYKSDSWDKGRPNIVDNNIKRTYRPTTIRYSQPYIPETNINGLSRFDDFDFEAYDQQYGDIRLLYSSDRLLNVFQRLKVGRVGISQSTIYSADGSTAAVSRVDKVLNEIIYHAGEYGIGDNPESFAVYGNAKYFVDVKRGVVCRLGGDGITPISEYKMHNAFTDMFEALDTNTLPYKVFGVYDFRFDEYIIHITNGTIQETIAFSESKNRWVSYYSYFPDYMVSNRTGLITFNQGQLYRHNTNTLYNNFYGYQYSSQIKFLSNIEPNKIKVFTNITEDSTDVWNMVEATNQYGQRTSLEEEDFEDVEGVYKATLLKDENTPNVTNALIEGDEMRSHSLAITLENDTTNFSKLFSVGVGATLSELTNK